MYILFNSIKDTCNYNHKPSSLCASWFHLIDREESHFLCLIVLKTRKARVVMVVSTESTVVF